MKLNIEKFTAKTVLGIDISNTRISVVQLTRIAGKIKLLKAVDCPVPDGALANGDITSPELLGSAIKKLLSQNKIHTRKAAVSLVASDVLTQIIGLPDEMPANMSQYVRGEIRHSVHLAGKELSYDFCGLGNNALKNAELLLVAATSAEKVAVLIKALSLAGIEPVAIEPAAIACLRAVYDKSVAMKYDSNVLLAVAGESTITIAVFTETTLDFIRCVDISSRSGDLEKYTDDCTREIGAVVQYYEIEAPETANGKWDTIIAYDGTSTDADDLKGRLEKMMNSEVHICCKQSVYADTPVEQNESIGEASIVAVGLAMKAFADSSSSSNININLVPSNTEDVIATKKFALITANLAAVAILVIFIIAGVVRVKLSKIPQEAQAQKQNTSTNDIRTLLTRGCELNEKIAALAEKKSKISEIIEGRYFGDWARLLEEIRKNIPTAMSVTNLSCNDGENITIKGRTPTRQSAYLFARLLSEAKAIKSATVEQTNKSNDGGGLDYSVNCVLVNDEETDNAER